MSSLYSDDERAIGCAVLTVGGIVAGCAAIVGACAASIAWTMWLAVVS